MLGMNCKFSNLAKCLFRTTTPSSRTLQYFPNIPPPPTLFTTRLLATQSSRGATQEITKSKDKVSIQRQKVVLNDEDLIETFVRGSGPGGQCINKRSNCVDLRHIPTGLRVQCQQTRSLAQNRGIARKILLAKLDDHFNGNLSKSAVKGKKIAKAKKRQMKRAREKYGNPALTEATTVDKNNDDDDEGEEQEDEEEMQYEEAVLEEVGYVRRQGHDEQGDGTLPNDKR
ncbi:hypothetical protein NQZ79_g8491 [Umbelopsis isabellina]|nr:hypothetical protein NQZ79_g8491 [Umbelopsis isabellina]